MMTLISVVTTSVIINVITILSTNMSLLSSQPVINRILVYIFVLVKVSEVMQSINQVFFYSKT